MARFDNYLDDVKKQTDTLRGVVSDKSGVDCSELSIGGVADVVKDIQTGGKDPVLQEKSVDPKTYSQEVTADEGYDGLSKLSVGAVTSNIDENITPTNIRAGVSILGVQGNLSSDKPDQSKTVTPTTSDQRVFADSGYELSEVLVKGVTKDIDSNIKAGNIKRGTTILGVSGEFDGGELQSKTATPTTSEQNVTADAGFYGLSEVKVKAVNPSDYYKDEEIVNVTPSTESQKITPTANKVFNEVNVGAVTSAIDSNILAGNIKKDVTILGVTGTLEQGGAEDLTEELTAQDEAITRLTLAVDGLGTGGESKELVIELPSEFADAKDIYTFQFNADKVLISANKDSIGVWEYSISSKTIIRLYNNYYQWKYFQVVGNKCIITGTNYATGVLIYDGETITLAYTSGNSWQYFKVMGDKCLISSSQFPGILLYDGNSVVSLYTSGNQWQYFQEVGDKCLISSSSSSTGGKGLLLFDGNTITQIYENFSSWRYFKTVGDKCLISSTNSNSGLLLFDGNSVTQIYDMGNQWGYFQEMGNKIIITSASSGSVGVLIFDGATVTLAFDSEYGWIYFNVIGDKCLIGGNDYAKGMLLFDGETITKAYSDGYGWKFFQNVDNVCLISGSKSGSGNTGMLLFDGEAITRAYTSGYNWQYFKVVGDKCLIGCNSTADTGVLLYSEGNITKKYNSGYNWEYFKDNSDGTIEITSSHSTYKNIILTYNPADDTVKVTKVKVV